MSILFPADTSTTIITVSTGTGGTIYYTTSTGLFTGTSFVHIFNASGFFTATQNLSVSYLAVAGGGAGGRDNYASGLGGGGGAGGMTTGTFTATQGTTYTINVGAGGTAICTGGAGPNGTPSSISGSGLSTITAIGGGGGGGGTPIAVGSGGSGGGQTINTSVGAGTPGQGNPGGTFQNYGGGGGGGAGAAGTPASPYPGRPYGQAGPGGIGSQSSISGTATYYAGGGGGAVYNTDQGGSGIGTTGGTGGGGGGGIYYYQVPGARHGINGTANTGGGGGGGANGDGGQFRLSGAGGPGVVVLSYAGPSSFTTTLTDNTVFTTGTNTWVYKSVIGRWLSSGEQTQVYTVSPTLLQDQPTSSTGYFDFPEGTTAERPANPIVGFIRFNTDIGYLEFYSSALVWSTIYPQIT
jgi:hypothetical protein